MPLDATNSSKTIDPALRFSYMEALHARGFTTVDMVQALASGQFGAALSGTVAFPRATDIYNLAMALPSNLGFSNPEPASGFQPINGGNLTNCEPPCHLSPFGYVAYLQALLKFSNGTNTLGTVLTTRRGQFGNLLVTEENLYTNVPVIDLINESLESLAVNLTSNVGAIYNTTSNFLTTLNVPGAPSIVEHGISEDDIVKALAQHSAPHLPLDQPAIYATLKTAIAGPKLPYSQVLDLSRTYLGAIGTSRFDVMRTFLENITEFALDALHEPADFIKQQWRLPLRYEIALEYLGISADEASIIFGGNMTGSVALQLLGLSGVEGGRNVSKVLQVTVFMQTMGITYCEFLELQRSGIVAFGPGTESERYPECLPCCDSDLLISFGCETSPAAGLVQLAVFIRLYRHLKRARPCDGITMEILAKICHVLGLFTNANVNPDFLTQLASLLLLKEIWDPPWACLINPVSTNPTNQCVSIWSGSAPDTLGFQLAVKALLESIEERAIRHYYCEKRSAAWHKITAANLDSLAALTGFVQDTWYSKPTCTIRFIEILTKLYASPFTVGEILFLFTTKEHVRGDDPFPWTEPEESFDDPLNVPEDDEKYGLWDLRRKLLQVEVCDDELEQWTWQRIKAVLHEMGYEDHGEQYSLTYFSEHYFPETLAKSGIPVAPQHRLFEVQMNKSPSPHIWHPLNACSPFTYWPNGADSEEKAILSTKLPLRNQEVLHILRDIRQLNTSEAAAVRALYLMPRAALAPFALLFSNFEHAANFMIQEPCEEERFKFFRKEVATFHKRCLVIAHHIHHAAQSAMRTDSEICRCNLEGFDNCKGLKVAWRVILSLIADENRPQTPWEDPNDTGIVPTGFTWDPKFCGSAFAALLGLIGTGLKGEYRGKASYFIWKEMRGGMSGWGEVCDDWNTPIPTVLPKLTISPPVGEESFISFKNGFALNQVSGMTLSGAEPFEIAWCGVLVVERSGCYHFTFSCPSHHDEDNEHFCACRCDEGKLWAIKLDRGEKHWTLLNKGIEDDDAFNVPEVHSRSIPLHHGAYNLTVIFKQLAPNFSSCDCYGDKKRVHAGFRLWYNGPDTNDCRDEVPLQTLYIEQKDGPLFVGGEQVPTSVTEVMNLRYVPTIRDIRRTYQRAFKSVLFSERLCLSACKLHCEEQSELGYLLDNPDAFQGTSYYWDTASSSFKSHHAFFDFNFLPVTDSYFPPSATTDERVAPSAKRQNAMFDWFERIFDYTALQCEVKRKCYPSLWLFFFHATLDSPQPVPQLLWRLGAEADLAPLLLQYYSTNGLFNLADNANINCLGDEIWTTRIWKAKLWLEHVRQSFWSPTSELVLCQPALWASIPEPDVTVNGTTGNINLAQFVLRSCLNMDSAALRLTDVTKWNDGLRIRARDALLGYLAANGQSATEISDHLLLDVETPIHNSISRIEDAVSSAQRLMQRAILGLEPSFPVDHHAVEAWECKLATFEKWAAGQRRVWYFENWLQWDEFKRLEKTEGFRSLGKALKSDVSTVANFARDFNWSGTVGIPREPGKASLSWSQKFVLGLQQQALDEGIDLMGTPDNSGQPTWVAPIGPSSMSGGGGEPPSDGGNNSSTAPITPRQDKEQGSARITGETGTLDRSQSKSLEAPTLAEDGVHEAEHVNAQESSVEVPVIQSDTRLPGASSLKSIPLWVQTALRLGVRFIRVAASSLPIAAPYHDGQSDKQSCCQCSEEHAPVIDEYYFWLQDARRFDPIDAPAPQDADTHVNVTGVSQTIDPNKPQIDPRTIQADPTSDWDAPTAQMLHWRSEPKVYLYWTRVHMGLLQDPRRSTEGLDLVDTDLSNLYLDLRGRNFDSLLFNVKEGDSSTGYRYDIVTDTATLIPEAVPNAAPPALPLPSSFVTDLAAFPYFLYFDGGGPLVPVDTFGTSMAIATSLRADCRYESSTKWLTISYDPLCRDNTWMQCASRGNDTSVVETKSEASIGDLLASTNLFSKSSEFNQIRATQATQPGTVSSSDPTAEQGITPDTETASSLLVPNANATNVASKSERSRWPQDATCCPTAPVKGGKARGRAVTLEYLETLFAWAESLRCRNSLEADQQALTLLTVAQRVMGQRPKDTLAADLTGGTMTINTFQASSPALNPRLVALYDKVWDAVSMVQCDVNRRRLRNGVIGRARAIYGSHRRFQIEQHSWKSMPESDCDDGACVYSCSQAYRFSAVLPKAVQWIAMTKSMGGALLLAFEKADSEALSALRAAQERQITELGLDVSKNQYRAADWDVQALDIQMANAVAKLQYYQALISAGLNFNENAYTFATTASMASRTAATVSDGIGQGMASTPDMWVGVAGAYGSPLQFQQMPMGVKLGTGFAAAARILNTVADISSSTAGLSSTEGGWDRRSQDWQHQCDVTVYEIQQIKRQRLAARRRLEISLRELNNTQRRIEHEAEVQDFMRDKFTKYELYLYLQQETAALYRQAFNASVQVAREAQQAARYELGDTSLDCVPSSAGAWDNLHSGLLAGEKLDLGITALERAYMNRHCREYELSKQISLKMDFPAAFVLLKSTGYCEVDLPEWLFDLDYPGHYMRRIKTVSLTIPCVAGPYTGVHCRLQLVSSSIRVRPIIEARNVCCKCDDASKTGNAPAKGSKEEVSSVTPAKKSTGLCIHDPHVVTRFAGTEAIATSTGQNDSGLFEVSFADQRYLPFEYSGAVSRWRIELPPENNQFDFDSLSDVVMHISFTSREGGPELRRVRRLAAQEYLPGNGLRFFDIRHEMPEAWAILRRNEPCQECEREPEACCELNERCECKRDKGSRGIESCWHPSHRHHREREFSLELTRQMFPFLNGCGQLEVTAMHILLDIPDCDRDCETPTLNAFEMCFTPPPNELSCPDVKQVPFVRTSGGIWTGGVELDRPLRLSDAAGPGIPWRGRRGLLGSLRVPCNLKGITRAWLLCKYKVVGRFEDKTRFC